MSRPTALISLSVLLFGVAPNVLQAQTDSTRKPPPELSKVVITATGTEQQRTKAPASITVLTREQLDRQRNNSLAEMLSTVEGIDVGNTMGKTGGLTISMRGMPADYTLILIDGRRQNAAGSITPNGFGETSTSFVPPLSAIERVEIIRGPMATLYGSDAMGGVVNIITRRVAKQWTGSFTTDATVQETPGFGSTQNANTTLSGPLVPGRVGLTLRGSWLHRNASTLTPTGEVGETTAISTRGPSPVGADVHSVGGRVAWTPNRQNELALDVDFARQGYDNRNAQLGTLDNPNGTPATFNGYGPRLAFNRDQFAITHTARFRAGRLESSLMRNLTETFGRTLPSGTPGGPPGSGAPNKVAGSARTLESTSDVFDTRFVSLRGRHLLTVGGQLWDAQMIDGVALTPFEQTQWSVFAEDQWNVLNAVTLTLGVRRDEHDSFGAQTSPRAYAVWSATPSVTIKGGVSAGYKTPRLEQLVDGIIGFTAQGRTASIGTPSLKPETSVSTDLGVYFDGSNGLSGSVSVFNNDFRDKITSGTPVPNCTFAGAPNAPGCVNYGSFPTQEVFSQSINIDEARTRGVEVAARVPVIARSALSANYTFTESTQESGNSAGFPLVNTPRHMANAQLRSAVTSRLDTWVRGEYRSSRARRLSANPNPAWDALGDFRAYGLMHIGGSYALPRGISIRASVDNVFNTDFLQFAAYDVAPTAANPSGVQYTNVYNNHQEGRRLWISTTVSF